MDYRTPGLPVLHQFPSLLKLMSVELVTPSSHLILCRPLLLPPSIFPSSRVFSNASFLCIKWPKCWSFSFSISPSNEYLGLISFRTDCNTPGFPVHHQLPELAQTNLHQVVDAIQPSLPLSSPSPPAPNPSQHQGLSNESTLHMRWPKYWSFSFSIGPSKGHPGLISFRMDWLDLLAVQGTLKSLLQHRRSKASVLRCSAFFTVHLSQCTLTTL